MPAMSKSDKPRFIELSVRLTDGSFACALSVPLDATKEQRDQLIKAWLAAMRVAVEIGSTPELSAET